MPLTNVRYAIRSLRRSPTFAAAAVLTLALGLGANTAVFSVVDAALLRPLPYGDPDRLVSVRDVNRNGSGGGVMLDKLTSYRAARSFEGLASFNRMSRTLTGSGEPEQVLGENVTVNLFTVVGVHPAIGRGFRPGDDVPAGEHVVVLTDGFWRRRFGADPSILGRTLVLNDVRHTVVGVMPRTFEPLTQPGSGFRIDFLVPEPVADASVIVRQVSIVGRLAPGVTQAQAQSELQGLSSDRVLSPIVTPIRDNFLRGNLRRSLGVMFGAVALVLLVACVNFGNLLIVHTIGLQREIATRIALGAARGEIALDLAARGLVLGGLGGILGLGGGVWIRTALVALAPRTIPGLDQAALNGRVLAFTLISSLVSGIAASLLPMLHFSHLDLAASVAGSGRSATGTRAAMRWRGILMSIEIAAAVVLTVGAGLLIQSQAALNRVELGFRTDGVLMFTVRLPETRYPDQPARLAFFEALEPQLAALGGVQAVALTDAFPARGGRRTDVTVPGGVTLRADTQLASPGYFTALRIRLQRGRTFGPLDRAGGEPVAIVSEAFVSRAFGGRDPIGQRIVLSPSPSPVTIVGVVGDVLRDGPVAALAAQVFIPAAQTASYDGRLGEVGILASRDPMTLVPDIRRIVEGLDPNQPITHVLLLDEVMAGATAPRRFNTLLLGALALLAVVLALVGVYGVVAHTAAQRRKEIGIRIALGARSRHVLASVAGRTLGWALAGAAVGLIGAYSGSQVLTGLLFGVPATDPATFATAIAFVLGVTLAASILPARRAAGIDPVSALRAD